MPTDFMQSNTAFPRFTGQESTEDKVEALSRQDKIIAAMKEMAWLTQAEKKYLWSTIYKSEYQGG